MESVHPETFFFKGIHTIDFKISSTLAQIHLEKYGFKTFLFCEAFQDEILSVLETVKLFVGGMGLHGSVPLFQPKIPEYMEKANIEFLKWGMNYQLVPRKVSKIDFDES